MRIRVMALCAAALFTFVSTSAEARYRHHHRHYARHHSEHVRVVHHRSHRRVAREPAVEHSRLTTFLCGQVPVRVASHVASRFEGFCRDMIAAGYPAKDVGGWRRHGSCRGCNMHPNGLAIDYDQVSRDRVTVRMSRERVSEIARQHGLISGGDWCHGDLGHFEVDTGSNAPACGSRTYAARSHRRSYGRVVQVAENEPRFDHAKGSF